MLQLKFELETEQKRKEDLLARVDVLNKVCTNTHICIYIKFSPSLIPPCADYITPQHRWYKASRSANKRRSCVTRRLLRPPSHAGCLDWSDQSLNTWTSRYVNYRLRCYGRFLLLTRICNITYLYIRGLLLSPTTRISRSIPQTPQTLPWLRAAVQPIRIIQRRFLKAIP